MRFAERFPKWRARLGVGVVFVGATLAIVGAYGLSLLQTMSFGCGEPFCKASGTIQYTGYVPWPIPVLVAVAGVAPLLVLLRPRLWWAGSACTLVVVGFFGEYYLYVANYVYIPGLVQAPWVVSLWAWILIASAVSTAVGLILIRPEGRAVRDAPVRPAATL